MESKAVPANSIAAVNSITSRIKRTVPDISSRLSDADISNRSRIVIVRPIKKDTNAVTDITPKPPI